MTARTTARTPDTSLDPVGSRQTIVGGLLVGAVLGFGGNFVEDPHVQSVMYGLSAAGLVVASLLLALEHSSQGQRLAAAGFALLALGETRVVNPTDVVGGEASFAVGVLLYAPALLLIATSTSAPRWVRLAGAAAAVPFAAHALGYLGGADIDSSEPLAGIGYALLTLAVIGWAHTVLRSGERKATAPREA